MTELSMRAPEAADASFFAVGQCVAGRYRIESEVGTGGAAQVVCAYDEQAGRRVALKALSQHGRSRNRERLLAAFRHEFSVLAQVAHPNVVRVYDFGFADDVPYYTMELLEGQSLSEIAPLDAGEVADMLCSLCEPLGILHARRWVHRDLSARNVIRTASGQIKLIDFGATVSMEDRPAPMGTPPFMAPEALAQEPLDARTDIFGLGALAYFALTAVHAYPARTLARLPGAWKQSPRGVRELAPQTSEALDALVMAMLSLDPAARPRSTAQVLQHLRAGTRHSVPVSGETAGAHLETPRLIGREPQLRKLQALLAAAAHGRGAVCVIQGERGIGRSRLLDELGLMARLAGHTVLRASGKLCGSEPLGLARTLGETALRLLVEDEHGAAPELAWLRSEQDATRLSSAAAADAQRALVGWLASHSERAPLVLLVDDIAAADAASQKMIAQLALMVRKRRLLLAVTSDPAEASEGALHVLRDHGLAITLAPFSEAEVEAWSRAVFGDVHNIARLGRWLFSASGGRPADCMAFAQYLVENRIAVRSAGAFRLPDTFDGLSLPTRVRDALELRLATLSERARTFIELLALEVTPAPFTVDQYLRLLAEQPDELTTAAELTAAAVLAATEHGYVVRNSAVLDWARARLTPERERALQRRLAGCYEVARREDATFALFAAYHLWKAGDLAAADALLGEADVSHYSSRGLAVAFTRSDAAIAMLEALLAYRKQVGAAPWKITTVRVALLARASVARADLVSYTDETLDGLRFDLGLDLWDEQPAELPLREKVSRCFNAALARHAATPEERRGVAPFAALRLLASACASASGAYVIRYEPQHIWRLSRTIGLFRGLSPSLDIIIDIVENPTRSQGWGADVSELQSRVVEATRHPVPELDDELRRGIHWLNSYYHAAQLAGEGNDAALQYVPGLEAQPVYAALGIQVRRIHALMTGRYRDAQRYRRERELLALQSESSDQHLHMSLLREQQAAYLCGDLLEMTRCGAELRERAERYPGWLPWLALNRVRVCVLSEDFTQARALAEQALAGLEPFSHGAWIHLATSLAEILLEQRQLAQGAAIARDVLERAAALGAKLDAIRYRLRMLIAGTEALLADPKEACGKLDAVLEEAAVTPGTQSLVYGRLVEIRCRVALAMGDEAAFTEHHGRLRQLYSQHPGLRGRYERMQRRARERFAQPQPEAAPHSPRWVERLQTALATQSADDHSDYLLSIVLDEVGAALGQLYRLDRGGRPVLAACRPKPPDAVLLAQAVRTFETYASSMLAESATQSVDATSETGTIDSAGARYETIWLRHPDEAEGLRGMLLVSADAERLAALTPDLQRAVCERLVQLG